MNHILKQAIEQNPTLKSYCLALEQVGFIYKNHSQDSKSMIILAEKEDSHLHELSITIDINSQKSSILLTSRLFWNNYEELSVPGKSVKLVIEGEFDNDYRYNHDFLIHATKRKSNVKHQDLTTTIDSMMKEIENTYQALTT